MKLKLTYSILTGLLLLIQLANEQPEESFEGILFSGQAVAIEDLAWQSGLPHGTAGTGKTRMTANLVVQKNAQLSRADQLLKCRCRSGE